jgi:hypothetical protein
MRANEPRALGGCKMHKEYEIQYTETLIYGFIVVGKILLRHGWLPGPATACKLTLSSQTSPVSPK